MSQIKTVTTVSGENEVTFDAFYSFVWFKNVGEGDVYVAPYSGFSAGDVDVSACPAGQMVRITARKEKVYILGASTLEIHAQNFSDCPFKVRAKGGEQITVTPLSVSENGVYTAPTGSAYSPVTVDVQEQPWEPLEDGYSNFWFELTDDTLSPWLNFSAKNADATIDWGDGSGEVALDTLTPTHTYSKAGKYVVKVKGVTGVAAQVVPPIDTNYMYVLANVEFNSEVTTLANYAFQYTGIREITFPSTVVTVGASVCRMCPFLKKTTISITSTATAVPSFAYCPSLIDIIIDTNYDSLANNFAFNCICLKSITLPSTISAIGQNAFSSCISLSEIHIQATTPPTLGTSALSNISPDYIIYVPVGTGDTYKAAWSAYADHIVEEGQTLSRAALRRIQAAEKTVDESEVR